MKREKQIEKCYNKKNRDKGGLEMEDARMGRPPKYSKKEAIKVRAKQHNEWAKNAYEKMTYSMPMGTRQKIERVAKIKGISKRQVVIEALEEYFQKTL